MTRWVFEWIRILLDQIGDHCSLSYIILLTVYWPHAVDRFSFQVCFSQVHIFILATCNFCIVFVMNVFCCTSVFQWISFYGSVLFLFSQWLLSCCCFLFEMAATLSPNNFFFAFSHNDVGAVRIKRCCFYSCLVRACCENVSCLRGRMAKMSGHGAWGMGSGPFSEPYLEIIVRYDMTSFLNCFA